MLPLHLDTHGNFFGVTVFWVQLCFCLMHSWMRVPRSPSHCVPVALDIVMMLVSGWNETSSVKPDFPCSLFRASLLLFSHQHFLVYARADVSKCLDLCTAACSSSWWRCRAVAVALPSCTFCFLRRPTRNFFFFPINVSLHTPGEA